MKVAMSSIFGSDNGTVGIGGVCLLDIDFDATTGKVNSFRLDGGSVIG